MHLDLLNAEVCRRHGLRNVQLVVELFEVVVKMARKGPIIVRRVRSLFDELVESVEGLFVKLTSPPIRQHVTQLVLVLMVEQKIEVALGVLDAVLWRLINLLNNCQNIEQVLLFVSEIVRDKEVVKLALIDLLNFVDVLAKFKIFLLDDLVNLVCCDLELLP